MITPVLNVTVSALNQADRLMTQVANASGGDPNDALRAFTVSVVGHAHRAMLYAYGLRSSHQVKHQRCPLNRALMVAAHQQRTCILRHANPRGLPAVAGKTGPAAPRNRVIRNWSLLVDELALPYPRPGTFALGAPSPRGCPPIGWTDSRGFAWVSFRQSSTVAARYQCGA